jgi:hypothetical protein
MAREGVPLNDPAPARAREPGCHFRLSRRDRHRRDHRHRPQPPTTHDLRERRTKHLKLATRPRAALALNGEGPLCAGHPRRGSGMGDGVLAG